MAPTVPGPGTDQKPICVRGGAAGNLKDIPFVVLILVALAAAGLAGVAARRRPLPVRPPDGPPATRLARRLDPETLTGLALTVALAAVFAGGVVLAVLAVLVRRTDALAGIDSAVARWGHDHATALSTHGLHAVTALGETWMAIVVGLLVALTELWRTRNPWVVPFLLAVIVGDKLLTSGLKDVVGRVRPDLNPVAATLGPSFPSGHSSTAAALWAAVALVVARWLGRRAIVPLSAAAVGIAVGVAASRVLLDVHWLTDVLAGLALGWAWFAACAVAFGGRVLRFGAVAERAAARPPGSRVRTSA